MFYPEPKDFLDKTIEFLFYALIVVIAVGVIEFFLA